MNTVDKVYSFGGKTKEAILFYESIFGRIPINNFLKIRDDKSFDDEFRETYKDLYKFVNCNICGMDVVFTDINFSDDGDIETFMFSSPDITNLNNIIKKLDVNNNDFQFTNDVFDFFVIDKFNKCWWLRRLV